MAAKKKVPSDNKVEGPPTRASWYGDDGSSTESGAPTATVSTGPQYNPATDPNKTAQERLDALTEQQRQMHAQQTGTYPLETPKK